MDALIIEAGEFEDSSPHSSAYEELLEIVTRAVAKLNIDWLAERQGAHPQSKLDESFLPSKVQPPHRGLTFFPDLHKEVSRSWRKPFSALVFSPHVSN